MDCLGEIDTNMFWIDKWMDRDGC